MSIMKDIANNNIVVLAGDNVLSSIHCKVSEVDALKVTRKEQILVLGIVKGMILNSIILDECQIFNPNSMK